jgi:outer membrane receptor for monomeric catechols
VKRVTVSTSPTTVSITDNGDAEVTGIEADFDFLISDNWRIGGAFSYTDSVFKDGAELVCNQYDEGGNVVIPPGQVAGSCDVGGDKLGPQPELTATLNSEYTATFGDSLEGYLRGLYRYVGDREDVDIDGLDPYQTFDLYLGLRDVSGRWDVGLFARNVFDEDEIIRGESPTTVRRQPTGYQLVDVVPERAIGLNASYHF